MKITKQLASTITKSLLDAKKKNLDSLIEALSQKVRNMYLKTIPSDVLRFSENHSGFIQKTSQIRIVGTGINHQVIAVESVPTTSGGYNQTVFCPKTSDCNIISKELNKIADARTKYKEAVSTIEATILSLRTFSRVREAFPEAEPFLKEPPKQQLVNIQQVRKLLK